MTYYLNTITIISYDELIYFQVNVNEDLPLFIIVNSTNTSFSNDIYLDRLYQLKLIISNHRKVFQPDMNNNVIDYFSKKEVYLENFIEGPIVLIYI